MRDPRPAGCLHCGDPVPGPDSFPVELDGVSRPTCCPGCQAVAGTVIAAGLDDFYRGHRVPGRLPEGLAPEVAIPEEHALYDQPELHARYVRPAAGERGERGLVTVDLAVEGMHCGACVWLLEKGLAGLPGMDSVQVNYASERAHLVWNADVLPLSAILATMARLGYRAWPYDASRREESARRHGRILLQRLFVAALIAAQAMMFALPGYLEGPDAIEPAYRALLQSAGLVLVLPVLLYSAAPFFRGAWRDIRTRRPGMDVPVAIALALAFIGSLRAVVTGVGDVYFDSIAMFTALLLGARYVEWRVRRRAAATIDALAAAAPETARLVQPDGSEAVVPVGRLSHGDTVVVHTGEPVPADARLLDRAAEFDQSLLTGESVPVAMQPSMLVPGGAMLASAPVRLQVERPAADSLLSVIARLAERGAAQKPAVARLADRVAAVFVPLILLMAAATGLVWAWLAPELAWPSAVAVLVVSCPCALSLATPTALAAAHAASLRRQLLLVGTEALETLPEITDIVFDKTGTLTAGKPALARLDVSPGTSSEQALAIAAGLEGGAAHPFALALLHACKGQPLPVEHQLQRTGAGVAGRIEVPGQPPQACFLGSSRWCGLGDGEQARAMLSGNDSDAVMSEVWLSARPWSDQTDGIAGPGPADGAQCLARFAFTDPLRDGAAALVHGLGAAGMTLHLLSGDRSVVAAAVADELGIGNVRGDADPQAKQDYVRGLQAAGRRVLMVGDGINDMPVLACADVSLAFGRPSALAQSAADVIVTHPRPDAVSELLNIGRRTRRIIRQNLTWAFGYNVLAIPLAALGWVPPWLAAIGMACSSLVVVINAARLLRSAQPRAVA